MITWWLRSQGRRLLGQWSWQAAVQILQRMKRHNSWIELGRWRQSFVRERWSRWGDRRNWEFSAVAMLSKVSLGLGGDGGWRWRWWEWILRVNLMQVRQAALLNCLLVVFMGDLNWWESASVFFLLFLKALFTSYHPSIPNPTQSHQSHFNMAPPGATPSLMKPWNPARSNFYRIKSQVYWGPNFNNFALISTAEQNF